MKEKVLTAERHQFTVYDSSNIGSAPVCIEEFFNTYIPNKDETSYDYRKDNSCIVVFHSTEFVYMEQHDIMKLGYADIVETLKNKTIVVFLCELDIDNDVINDEHGAVLNTILTDSKYAADNKLLHKNGYKSALGIIGRIYGKALFAKLATPFIYQLFKHSNSTDTTNGTELPSNDIVEKKIPVSNKKECDKRRKSYSELTIRRYNIDPTVNLDNVPLFVADYVSTLIEEDKTNSSVYVIDGDINECEQIKIKHDAFPRAMFYQLAYTEDDYDHDPWASGEVTLGTLRRDKAAQIKKLRSMGFCDMNHIFGYQESIIFMKSNPVEMTRFQITKYFQSASIDLANDLKWMYIRGRMYPGSSGNNIGFKLNIEQKKDISDNKKHEFSTDKEEN